MAADSTLVSAVDRMKKGEEEGFNYVYSRTFNYVYFRARSLMKNEDDARDLTQIVYMEAYKSIGTLDSPENIFSWLGGITYRQGMKLFRKKTDVLLDEDFEGVFENVVSTDKDTQPELSAEGQERAGIVKEAIESLPEVQKATVIAYYFDGMKVEEIADMMDCSAGTVKSRLNYARKAMKKSLMRNPRLGRGNESSAERALKLLSFPVIFCAIQSMSESTVMAAPAAQALYAGICGGIGLTAGTVVTTAAGTALAGAGAAGSGLSAAGTIGSVAGNSVSAASVATAGSAAVGGAMTGTAAITGTTAVAGAGAAISSAVTSTAAATTAGIAATTGAAVAATGTAATGAAAAGSAVAATTAAATAAAAGGAAGAATAAVGTGVAVKSAAIALAVAVTGAGVGVGNHVLQEKGAVSTASVSYNAEYDSEEDEEEEEMIAEVVSESSEESAVVSVNTPESSDEFFEEVVGESAVSGNNVDSAETVSASELPDVVEIVEEDIEAESTVSENEAVKNAKSEPEDKKVSENKAVKPEKPDESVSKNTLVPVSANESAYKVTEKAKNYIAESVASMVLLTGSENYDGPVSNDQLRIWHEGAIQYLALSGADSGKQSEGRVIREPIVYEAAKKDGRITVSGSFVIDSKDAASQWKSDIYIFSLSGVRDTNEVKYGKIQSDTLRIVNVSRQKPLPEHPKTVSSNETKEIEPSVSVNEPDQTTSVSSDMPAVIEGFEAEETGAAVPSVVYPAESEFADSLTGNSESDVVYAPPIMMVE